ncbi:hypothetical protein ERJ75_001059500 [Trypanosoma vivax]|uniref:Uncharacterized protein n=1 Tax=Trypanosoma vivax (strain Y486) TaxID=1055687 RepID=G0U0K1_TRYVY|nr:hypothetical protein TRVL_01769 [Trypanosoma vivax]KAH8610911.1 hypothetical protein ERJ75_001059500 [Trypanosoma vivax]CCC49600.1 conserved hypothetical protein [Trypanosoma vivax Y486]
MRKSKLVTETCGGSYTGTGSTASRSNSSEDLRRTESVATGAELSTTSDSRRSSERSTTTESIRDVTSVLSDRVSCPQKETPKVPPNGSETMKEDNSGSSVITSGTSSLPNGGGEAKGKPDVPVEESRGHSSPCGVVNTQCSGCPVTGEVAASDPAARLQVVEQMLLHVIALNRELKLEVTETKHELELSRQALKQCQGLCKGCAICSAASRNTIRAPPCMGGPHHSGRHMVSENKGPSAGIRTQQTHVRPRRHTDPSQGASALETATRCRGLRCLGVDCMLGGSLLTGGGGPHVPERLCVMPNTRGRSVSKERNPVPNRTWTTVARTHSRPCRQGRLEGPRAKARTPEPISARGRTWRNSYCQTRGRSQIKDMGGATLCRCGHSCLHTQMGSVKPHHTPCRVTHPAHTSPSPPVGAFRSTVFTPQSRGNSKTRQEAGLTRKRAVSQKGKNRPEPTTNTTVRRDMAKMRRPVAQQARGHQPLRDSTVRKKNTRTDSPSQLRQAVLPSKAVGEVDIETLHRQCWERSREILDQLNRMLGNNS